MADWYVKDYCATSFCGCSDSIYLPPDARLTMGYGGLGNQSFNFGWWERTRFGGLYDQIATQCDDVANGMYKGWSIGHEMGFLYVCVENDNHDWLRDSVCGPDTEWPLTPIWTHYMFQVMQYDKCLDWEQQIFQQVMWFSFYVNGVFQYTRELDFSDQPLFNEPLPLILRQVADGDLDEFAVVYNPIGGEMLAGHLYNVGLQRKLQLTDFDGWGDRGWFSNLDEINGNQISGTYYDQVAGVGGSYAEGNPMNAILDNGAGEMLFVDGGITDRVATSGGPSIYRIRSPFKAQWTGCIFKQGD
jgi:hypothetical protein